MGNREVVSASWLGCSRTCNAFLAHANTLPADALRALNPCLREYCMFGESAPPSYPRGRVPPLPVALPQAPDAPRTVRPALRRLLASTLPPIEPTCLFARGARPAGSRRTAGIRIFRPGRPSSTSPRCRIVSRRAVRTPRDARSDQPNYARGCLETLLPDPEG